ncbi:hypothetical protein BDZ91DRAFT_718658 [Kalaharituber pfeilii]|nr:hypothetical protein BDZ91DRAFT_718658 [Kalaharituber pfeilii]
MSLTGRLRCPLQTVPLFAILPPPTTSYHLRSLLITINHFCFRVLCIYSILYIFYKSLCFPFILRRVRSPTLLKTLRGVWLSR